MFDHHRDVTFLVPFYRGADRLGDCLRSIRHWFAESPIIVVDDGSPEFGKLVWATDSVGATIVPLGQHLGRAAAINAGMENCRTTWVVKTDPDVGFHGSLWLDRHIGILTADKWNHVLGEKVGAVGGWGEPWFFGPKAQLYSILDLRGHEHRTTLRWNLGVGLHGYCEAVNGCLMTARTSVMQTITFDQRLTILDDVAICARLKQVGYVCAMYPAEIYHDMGALDGLYEIKPATRADDILNIIGYYADCWQGRRGPGEIEHFMQMGRYQ